MPQQTTLMCSDLFHQHHVALHPNAKCEVCIESVKHAFETRFQNISSLIFVNKTFFARLYFKNSYCPTQGCKLLSDIRQCPTKFGKCPSKSNFDWTLVRSQKKNCHIIHFFRCIGMAIQTCLVTYIYFATYICPTN
jgi:hypothetical protein